MIEMHRYLEVHEESGWVINEIIYDGVSEYSLPGIVLYACEDHPGVHTGWRLVGNKWVAPEVVAETE